MADSKNRPKLNEEFCNGCNACVRACDNECIKKGIKKQQPPIFELKDCNGCGECAKICFQNPPAIVMWTPDDFDNWEAIEEENTFIAEQKKRMGTGKLQTAGV